MFLQSLVTSVLLQPREAVATNLLRRNAPHPSLSAGCNPETFNCGAFPILAAISEAQSDQLY